MSEFVSIIPPRGEKEKADCEHLMARVNAHRCPECMGTLRRCCLSLVGRYRHADYCAAHEERSRGKQ